MIHNPNKRYPYQPGFFSKPVIYGYKVIPVIDTNIPFMYACFITMNGYGVAITRNGTKEECEVMGFNGMQQMVLDET